MSEFEGGKLGVCCEDCRPRHMLEDLEGGHEILVKMWSYLDDLRVEDYVDEIVGKGDLFLYFFGDFVFKKTVFCGSKEALVRDVFYFELQHTAFWGLLPKNRVTRMAYRAYMRVCEIVGLP